MQLVVLGLNHKTAPVDVRECFAFSEEQVKTSLRHVIDYEELNEVVILSTCNRTEMYAVVEDVGDALPVMQGYMETASAGAEPASRYFFVYSDEDCVRHLFRVVSSLDSLVVGEGQILSQVKKAYALAREAETTSTVLNMLFNKAIAVGKKVRTETRIAYSAVSVSYAAVELAKDIFGDLSASNVLLLGAGQMSELTARHLVDNGVKTVFVSNRNYDRAHALARHFRGEAVPFENFMQCAEQADIIITSTGAPHYIVKAWDASLLMARRRGKPVVFIDIAVPRDVEPEVANVKGARVYNIDDLEAVVDSNRKIREQEARLAEKIVEEERRELMDKFRYLSFRPTMELLQSKAERIRRREVKRAMAKLPDLTPEQRKAVENMSKMIIRKMLRDPMMRMHRSAGTEHEQYYVNAAQALFKLDS